MGQIYLAAIVFAFFAVLAIGSIASYDSGSQIKGLASGFKGALIKLALAFRSPVTIADEKEIAALKRQITSLDAQIQLSAHYVAGLESKIADLKKPRLFEGQMYYDQNNHSAQTIKVMGRFNDWYMISEAKGSRPEVLTIAEFTEQYGHYVRFRPINNVKKLG